MPTFAAPAFEPDGWVALAFFAAATLASSAAMMSMTLGFSAATSGTSNSSPSAFIWMSAMHLLAVLVVVLLRLEVGGQRLHERLGHRDLLLAHLDSVEALEFGDLRRVDDLVGVRQRRHHQPAVLGADRRRVLLVAHDEAADGDLAARLHRPRQQHVGLGWAVRCEVVRGVVVHRVDLGQVDELLEVDRLRRHRHERLELVRIDHDVAALGDLVALDDVVVADFLTGFGVDLPVADARHVALVELVERHALAPDRVEQLDGDRHQSERDRAAPYGTCHVTSQSHRPGSPRAGRRS